MQTHTTIIHGDTANHTALATLDLRGQQSPRDGDDVMIVVTLHLPTEEGSGALLHPDLQFGTRVKIGGDPLYSTWGHHTDGSDTRYITHTVHAPTWCAATKLARTWAVDALAPLVAATTARRAALAAA